jgi:glucose-6-phosphate 1-dehydrogenase
MVVFGADGDLSRRKLIPALYHLHREGLLPEGFRIVGSSTSIMETDDFRRLVREATGRFSRCSVEDADWTDFESRLSYVSKAFEPGATTGVRKAVEEAARSIGGEPQTIYYLAVPPPAFGPITEALEEGGLATKAKVVFEKPFGSDLDSFRKLDALVNGILRSEQVYRIDHFLGKETVQNILALRFANGIFEPVWNREHIDQVQIDVPEEIGVGTRAGFYDRAGALRDMLVTHLLQTMSIVAMEAPERFESDLLIDEKVKVFEALRPLQLEDIVRGQYEGYRKSEGVPPDSDTETLIAARVWLDNERWEGVPFYLRTGKRMPQSRQTITLAFRPSTTDLFDLVPVHGMAQDHITFDLGADEAITINFRAKVPGPEVVLGPAEMSFSYSGSFGSELIGPYERLILDALMGDRTLFTRPDGIGRTWEVVAKVLEDPPPVSIYPEGSWGPKEAEDLIAPGRWHLPED